MTPFALYFLKVNVAFILLYLFYKSTSNKDTFLGLRRVVLLLIYITAVCYPLINISGWLATHGETSGIYAIYSVFLPEVVSTSAKTVVESNLFSWYNVIAIVYLSGVALLLMRTLLEFYRIYLLVRSCRKETIHGITVHVLPEPKEPFSFMKWICIYPDVYEDNELKEILIHENTHVKQWHSLDIIFSQLAIIICWFNPFVWLMRAEIRINHEYIADKRVICSGFNKKLYQYHLIGLKQSPQLAAANLYNNFSVLPLKNRIKMLNRKQTPGIMRSKYLMFIPILALLIFFSNCQDSQKEVEQPASTPAPEVVQEEKTDIVETKAVESGTVFEVVETMPSYPGGNTAFMKFLSENIKYPVDAQKEGIQGRVIIQFVVNREGKVVDPVVVRSVSESLDKEALRVVELMPTWIPGQQKGKNVNVKYTVPVSFRLQ